MSKKIEPICIFLCGDVMTGRGIDQVLPHPGNPVLYESYVRDARYYVEIGREVSGPIPQPVDFNYIWGDALKVLEQAGTDVRIINLETSITTSNDYWPYKEALYRMHPENIGCLTAAGIDCCCLANNHLLDWGYKGLTETIKTLNMAGVSHTGAGDNDTVAASPAIFNIAGKGRVLVFSFGSTSSGIPLKWAATRDRPGINLLEDLSEDTVQHIVRWIGQFKQPGDVIVASIHWGGNWGYYIPNEQINFAHRLVEEGVSIVHGHSSHHVRPIEVYQNRLILYGCGDFITDYEGISGYEAFRDDLAIAYLAKVDPTNGELVEVKLVPMQVRQFQLKAALTGDIEWLMNLLNRLGTPFGTQVKVENNNSLTLYWQQNHKQIGLSSSVTQI
ncbi:MAG: CapA family protein [Acidobacteriota bacterium]